MSDQREVRPPGVHTAYRIISNYLTKCAGKPTSDQVWELSNEIFEGCAAEIARLRVVKTATLKIADERAKEAVELRAKLESARKALEHIADIADGSSTVNSLPHIAKIARAALTDDLGGK